MFLYYNSLGANFNRFLKTTMRMVHSKKGILQGVAVTSIFGVIIAAYILLYKRIGSRLKGCKVNRHEEPEQSESYKLTSVDELMYKIDCSPICTLTWFKGDYRNARIHLEKRMRHLIEKNPWLQGRIVKYGPMWRFKHRLSYTVPEKYDDIINDYLLTIEPKKSPISRESPIGDIGRVIHKCHPGLFLKNGPNEQLFRVVVIPCSKNPYEMFGLFVQLSHVAGDGATYYQLLHMLCSKDEDTIVQLNAERNFKSKEILIASLGKDEVDSLLSFGRLIRGFLDSIAFRFTCHHFSLRFGWVDPSKIKEAKESAIRSQKEDDNKVQFVSTNDIITSWFMNQTKCPVGDMAINLRGRLEGYSPFDAGNYEATIFYQKEDFACPTLIRQSLGGIKGTNDDGVVLYKRVITRNIPGWFETATTKRSLVTNWSTFAKPNEIEGCEEDLHLPVVSFQSFLPYPVLVIFRGGSRKLGLSYFHLTHSNALDECPFLMKE